MASQVQTEESPVVSIDSSDDEVLVTVQSKKRRYQGIASKIPDTPTKSSRPTFVHLVKLETGNYCHMNLNAGKSVCLKDGSVLKIADIWIDDQDQLSLIGRKLVKPFTQSTDGELLWEVKPYNRSGRSDRLLSRNEVLEEQECLASEVTGICRLVFTNIPDFDQRYIHQRDKSSSPLFYCRRKWLCSSSNKPSRAGVAYINLTYDEADPNFRYSNVDLRARWRGNTILKGSWPNPKRTGIDPDTWTGKRRYTLIDAFCGAGGVSRGAKMAGLVIEAGFDSNEAAIRSYRLNFEADGTIGFLLDVAHFLQIAKDEHFIVDILHISPPCQPFSPAHTTSNNPQRDEDNEAVLFATRQLIERLKPRIVTMEQTNGLPGRHGNFFSTLINIFHDLGYSIRWKILNTLSYGVPQIRKRLFIIAAGPGEVLPHFPPATHGREDNLQPIRTIQDAIGSIPENTPNHNIGQFRGGPRTPFDANQPSRTITTSAGELNFHPSGTRPYTLRELARLQTFPDDHIFDDPTIGDVRRQIGNAVPPRMAKAVFKACMKSLERTDRDGMPST